MLLLPDSLMGLALESVLQETTAWMLSCPALPIPARDTPSLQVTTTSTRQTYTTRVPRRAARTMPHRDCQRLAEIGSPAADADHSLTMETIYRPPDSRNKDSVRDPVTNQTVSKEDVRCDDDVDEERGDAIRAGSDVSRSRDVDGGWAWVVLLTTSLTLAIQEALFSMVGMFQVEFQMAFGGSRGFLTLIGSFFVTLSGVLAPVAGALSTQLTPRMTLMTGGVLTSLGTLSGSFASSPTTLLLTYGVLGGLGNALIFTPSATAFSAYFVRLRQVANGVVMAVGGLGALLGPYLIRGIIDAHGWRYSLAVTGFLTAQICVLGALVFPRSGSPGLRSFSRACARHVPKKKKEKKEKKEKKKEKKEEKDLECGARMEKAEMTTAFLGGKSGADLKVFDVQEKVTKSCGRGSLRSRVWKVVETKEVWIVCVSATLLMTGYNIELLHQPSYVQSIGVDSRHFPDLFLAFGLCVTFVRIAGGVVFTRFDNLVIPAMFVSDMVMALALAFMPLYGVTLPALFVFNVVTGLCFGVGFMLPVPALIKFIGVELLPLAYGLMLMGCGSASILSVTLAGVLYDFLGTYKASFYLAGCLTGTGALTLLLLFCVRRHQTEEKTSDNVDTRLFIREQEAQFR